MRLRTLPVLALSAAALLAAGCGGSESSDASGDDGAADGADGADGKAVTIELDAQNDSGESGTATLTADGATTRVVLALENPASDSPQPAHIHKGTCADLDPAPAYPLANVTAGASDTTVEVPLEELRNGRFAINVHKSEAEAEAYVSCGTIGEAAASEEDEDSGGPGYGY
jgi:hypothetical protein